MLQKFTLHAKIKARNSAEAAVGQLTQINFYD
jgi:hypothetical protein